MFRSRRGSTLRRRAGVGWTLDNKTRCGDCNKQSDVIIRVMGKLCSSSVAQDEEDPFAGVGVWFIENPESSKEDEVNGLEDEEILILS